MKVTEFEHPSHPHILTLKPSGEPYKCDGCKELGFGPCYHCQDCNYHLHEECAMASESAYHPFFKKCHFIFRNETYDRICDACGKDVMGVSYKCLHDKAHDLHPCCLKLQHTIYGDGGIKLKLSDKVSSKCLKCKSKEISKGKKGWSYVSSCGEFCYHVACVKDLVLENWKNGYFDGDVDQKNNLALMQIGTSSTSTCTCNEVVESGGGWFGSKGKRFWRIARMVLKLVISAIFGDPIAGIAIVVEALNS